MTAVRARGGYPALTGRNMRFLGEYEEFKAYDLAAMEGYLLWNIWFGGGPVP
jgi:hypothetical protein